MMSAHTQESVNDMAEIQKMLTVAQKQAKRDTKSERRIQPRSALLKRYALRYRIQVNVKQHIH